MHALKLDQVEVDGADSVITRQQYIFFHLEHRQNCWSPTIPLPLTLTLQLNTNDAEIAVSY